MTINEAVMVVTVAIRKAEEVDIKAGVDISPDTRAVAMEAEATGAAPRIDTLGRCNTVIFI